MKFVKHKVDQGKEVYLMLLGEPSYFYPEKRKIGGLSRQPLLFLGEFPHCECDVKFQANLQRHTIFFYRKLAEQEV
jgi:hypothetical protein